MNKLAIVVPYYKIDFFEETLLSIYQQTDKRFTLYIGNDLSPNNPLQLIDKYFDKTNYQYFDYKENLGGKNLASQWERILENVTEEWFQILGDDDMIADNFVEEFYKNIEQIENQKISIVKISQCLIDENSIQNTTFSSYQKIISTKTFLEGKFLLSERSSLSEHIFKLSEYKEYRFKKYPLAWHSDDMAVVQLSIPHGIYFINSTHVLVRFSEKSISGDVSNDKNNNLKEEASYYFFEDLLNKYHKYIAKENVENILKEQIFRAWKLKKKSSLNLFSIYLYINQPIKILTIPYKKYILNKNAIKQ
ncbi:Glycosyl transferase family 2 [Chishuiella changwenlii]|uniref:Glycosyl transferase n=1 Tax=Chishuiella changwenlii TaxID=1434701 RepID=A0A1M6TXS7_9FLAO|nr:glycosyltransferase family A protein [Chishuiella changwenlii]GGF11626.1 glycosyl transferase [Chishuiella changwenlii]SHK61711.1 Glycosyl transferase family 2 [Chishuiella changwenlii]